MIAAASYFWFLVPIVVLLVAHWAADFCFQNAWMATNKSSSLVPLTVHIVVYSTVLFFATWAGLLMLTGHLPFVFTVPNLARFVVVNALAHFLTDLVSSRLTSWAWKNERERLFFTIIGADQLAHVGVLVLTVPLFLVG